MKQPNILYTAVKALIKNDEGKVLVLKQSDPTITGDNQYHPPVALSNWAKPYGIAWSVKYMKKLALMATLKNFSM
jgi:hypothetical protein